jgi:hypothetical protein
MNQTLPFCAVFAEFSIQDQTPIEAQAMQGSMDFVREFQL